MIDKNPIDDLFKGLAEAEVAPPASVWEGIVAQRSWSEGLLVSLRKYWWVPLLFLSITGAGIGAALSESAQETDTVTGLSHDQSQQISNTSIPAVPSPSDPKGPNEQIMSTSDKMPSIIPDGDGQGVTSEATFKNESRKGQYEQVIQVADSDLSHDATGVDRSVETGRAEPHQPSSQAQGRDILRSSASTDEQVERENRGIRTEVYAPQPSTKFGLAVYNSKIASKRVVLPQRTVTRPSLQPGRKSNGTAGYIPPGDWWFGGSVGYSILSVDHEGSESDLIDILNQHEGGSHAISLEMLAGRLWRTGFFASAGIGTETFTTRFDYTDPTGVELKATNRYSMFTIPVAMGWQKELGRFEVGPAVGLQLELSTSRKGYTFVSPEDVDSLSVGPFSIIDLDDADINGRYGSAISGSVSLHVGLKMSEFFSIWARPEYVSRLTTLSNDAVEMNADRAGLRFGIRYIMPYNH